MTTLSIEEKEFNILEVRRFLSDDLSPNEITRLLMGIKTLVGTFPLKLSELRDALQDSFDQPLLNRAIMALKINSEVS